MGVCKVTWEFRESDGFPAWLPLRRRFWRTGLHPAMTEVCRFQLASGMYMRVSRVASWQYPGTGVGLRHQRVNILIRTSTSNGAQIFSLVDCHDRFFTYLSRCDSFSSCLLSPFTRTPLSPYPAWSWSTLLSPSPKTQPSRTSQNQRNAQSNTKVETPN